ncbi:DoxX family protein [Poriferisphaera sp. WC338]|uniref:DoxX family protein n=1 Tax=Poriferisphaera sp. WC338 TaxID=3425129 RepID=UPI003D81A0EA
MCKAYFTLTHLLAKSGLGPLLLRLMVGWVFIYHGTQKLFGWFDGPGVANATEYFKTLNIPLPELAVYVAAWGELVGGVLLVLGLFTRPASLALAIIMAVAIYSVHLANGFSMQNNGYEYQSVLGVVAIAFLFAGPGCISIDRLICLCCGGSKCKTECDDSKTEACDNKPADDQNQDEEETGEGHA